MGLEQGKHGTLDKGATGVGIAMKADESLTPMQLGGVTGERNWSECEGPALRTSLAGAGLWI